MQINNHLNAEVISSPKDIYPSLSKIKTAAVPDKEEKHKKNSSLNLEP